MKPLLAALRFLTILPLPGTWGTAEEDRLRRRLEHGTPPCLVERPAGRVLVARHHVEELDVRPAQRCGDEVDVQTVGIGRHRPDRRLERGEDLEGGQIAGIFSEDHVPRL